MNYIKEENVISFIEIPDEISLVFSITGCMHHCKGCHSPYLWDKNNGIHLNFFSFAKKVFQYRRTVSTIVFFNGEKEFLFPFLLLSKLLGFKTAIFSGYENKKDLRFSNRILLDFIKLGKYIESLGGLSSNKTNQKLYYHNKDITNKYWRQHA